MTAMDKGLPRKLPPMSALEFSIEQAFRRYFFGVRLILGWLIVLAPFLFAVYYIVFRDGVPEPATLVPVQIAALAGLAVVGLLASISVAVNWSRRVLLDERPQGLAWWRLNGIVWRYLFNLIVILVVLAVFAAAIATTIKLGVPALEPKFGKSAKPLCNVVAVFIGLLALLVGYRLGIKLPAVAVGNRDFSFGQAWRVTRKNSGRYLAFTFWLIFALAIANAISSGAIFAAQKLASPKITAAAIVVTAIVGLFSVLVKLSVATGHYRFFGEGKEFPAEDQ